MQNLRFSKTLFKRNNFPVIGVNVQLDGKLPNGRIFFHQEDLIIARGVIFQPISFSSPLVTFLKLKVAARVEWRIFRLLGFRGRDGIRGGGGIRGRDGTRGRDGFRGRESTRGRERCFPPNQ